MILDKKKASRPVWFALALSIAVLTGCSSPQRAGAPQPTTPTSSAQHLHVAATISTLAALVKAVGGDKVEVVSIVPIGVSPETYDPSPRDLIALANAQIIFKNGAGLEIWLDKMLRAVAKPSTKVVVLSDGLPVAGAKGPGEPGNPHLWLDPTYAQAYVRKMADAMSEVDPANGADYRARERDELAHLAELDAWIKQRIATIPPANRTMLTFHDAWYYFDRRYGIRDVGAIEQSPGQSPSAAYLAALIGQARASGTRAVFAEPQFSPKLARQLADSAGIKTVTDLYDDTLGTTPQLQTYEGMMRYDVDTIVKALTS
jgi:manganese/iron transport system substrate-binding protein